MTRFDAERGSVLIVSLIFLLLLTIVGVSSMSMTNLEERMAGNFRDHDSAFQAAEAALLDAEEYVESSFDITSAYTSPACTGANCYSSACTGGLCFHGTFENSTTPVKDCSPGTVKEWEDNSIWSTASKTRGLSDQISGTVENARYIIEFRCFMPRDPSNATPDADIFAQWSPAFRITAVASGTSTDSTVMLQSIYKLVN
ncbi:PilX N-terminal domain-containing pilus assembly protein [Marinobacter nauticus]|uniref:Type IV pilus assembly protein PilX n=1 Tax=Marinobacter nauticus TaxID=2743 RepID=A0A368UUJ4_MARNT|nr:PilX N-terminal domain-containing pilus assembly protein [Marinobacter nauticus]RBP70380.1 type IV pilus assembly protein PilX [Marinobacter nauticus]RCW31765.1 type IV pilus assembly protein PilX [Marinobacter nauticus]